MHAGRLSLFLFLTLLLPNSQTVRPHRDVDAEETVAVQFQRIRRKAGLPELSRGEGIAFSQAACRAAAHSRTDKILVEDANYTAMIYSAAKPEDAGPVIELAKRSWAHDREFVVGACAATTPEYSGGRYWVAVGVLGRTSERRVADLLSGQ